MTNSSRLNRRHTLPLGAAATAAHFGVQAQTPAELRIGFQKGSINLVLLKSLNLLDKHLPGTAVKWVEFPAGPQLQEALAVGGVEVGAGGDSPPVFGEAADKVATG